MASTSPTVLDRTVTAFVVNATAHLVNMPATVNAGDLLIIVFANDDAPGTSDVTWPGGWTEIHNATSIIRLSVAYLVADGTEGGTTVDVVTSAVEQAHAVVYRITGHVSPTTQPPEVSTGASGISDTPDPDTIAPTGGSKDYLFLATHGHDGGTRTTTGFPASYTNGQSSEGGTNFHGCGIGTAERILTADTEDPGTFTISASDSWQAATIAVHPPVLLPERGIMRGVQRGVMRGA